MTLDLFQIIPDVEESRLHPKFKFLRDEQQLFSERNIIINWTEGFIDRDNKIIKEFQTTFHSSFWEFFLHAVLREANFEIDFTRDRPDFIITGPAEINIEAVVSNIKQDGVAEDQRNAENLMSMLNPPNRQKDFPLFLNEAIVRNSNAILSKNKKFLNSYANCQWMNPDKPFIIALSSFGQIDYGREYYYPLMALLYGLYFDPDKNDFRVITEIVKPNTDSPIPIGLFTDPSMEHISAIIFSCTTTLGKLTSLAISQTDANPTINKVVLIREDYELPKYKVQPVSPDNPEELSDGLFIFHNPFAKNKISKEIFKSTNIFQITFDDRVLEFEGENLPIVSRFNSPFMSFEAIKLHVHKVFNS